MRKIIIALSCCTVLLLLGFVGYRGYHVWKEKKWISMARDFNAKSDTRNTLLCLQQVLRFNARNVEAARMVATINEAARSPGALVWRYRVLEINPKSLDDRLALAKTALLLGNYSAATNALAGVDDAGRKTAAFQNLAGTVAVTLGDAPAAEACFTEAIRLEPWNSVPQLNLSVVRLQGTNTLDMAEARIALARVSQTSTNRENRSQALRELVVDAVRFKQVDQALSLSQELLRQTNSIFRDRLLYLDVLHEFKQPGFKSTLAGMQREATTDAVRIFELAMWQMGRMGPADTIGWLNSLPVNTQTNQSVAMIMADCRTMLQDWTGLQRTLGQQNWAELDFMRHASLARALRNLDLAAAAKAEWGQAIQSTGNQKGQLTMLLQFAARAKWLSEAEELLWTIVKLYPEDLIAAQGLANALYENGRTRPLLNLLILQAKRKPDDLGVKNNLAMTALLLEAHELKPHELAREVYQKAPTNSSYASTYAFSLHLQGRSAEALKIFQNLKPKELENPANAGYYGLVLNATGNKAKARVYLDWAFKSPMLPEEKKLFERARGGD